jgi:hypothetical protein
MYVSVDDEVCVEVIQIAPERPDFSSLTQFSRTKEGTVPEGERACGRVLRQFIVQPSFLIGVGIAWHRFAGIVTAGIEGDQVPRSETETVIAFTPVASASAEIIEISARMFRPVLMVAD